MARNGSAFDAIIKKYRLKDPALLDLAEIVRTADAGKVPHPRPEGAGLEAAALGFRQVAKDGHETIRLQFPLYDALYAYCKWRVEQGGRLEFSALGVCSVSASHCGSRVPEASLG